MSVQRYFVSPSQLSTAANLGWDTMKDPSEVEEEDEGCHYDSKKRHLFDVMFEYLKPPEEIEWKIVINDSERYLFDVLIEYLKSPMEMDFD